ncbi:archaetidylserine decarboxylase [Gallibacterium trehalosifermentans]|uniref:Phosphatidylserine decarboxylase proenzyme n=1 Tax=Gallibacterium trehalosifermentans TaxID=516935 RepID=A0ABV6GZQ8_9PAST
MNKTITYFDKLKVAFHYVLPQLWVTRAAGWLAEKQWGVVTHTIIRLFIKKYRINMQEALYSDVKDYASFNQFFIRPLRDGVRPINQDPNALCLPADGRVSQLGAIDEGRLIQAKGHYFSLTDLLAGDAELSATFKNGQFITTYLSPKDYHRVHMPCAGTLRKMIYVPGELYSVNPFLAEHIPHLFSRNERVICLFETEFGPMVQILVGATITASMSTVWAGVINPPRPSEIQTWHYPAKGESGEIHLEKGQEMGAFRLGSTVINIFAENQVEFATYLYQDTAVRVGELLAHKVQ